MTTQKSRQDSPGRPGAVFLLLKGHVTNCIKSPDHRGSLFRPNGNRNRIEPFGSVLMAMRSSTESDSCPASMRDSSRRPMRGRWKRWKVVWTFQATGEIGVSISTAAAVSTDRRERSRSNARGPHQLWGIVRAGLFRLNRLPGQRTGAPPPRLRLRPALPEAHFLWSRAVDPDPEIVGRLGEANASSSSTHPDTPSASVTNAARLPKSCGLRCDGPGGDPSPARGPAATGDPGRCRAGGG